MTDSNSRDAPLTMDASEFRRIGHRLVDIIAEHLSTLPQRPVNRNESPADVHALIDGHAPLPETGRDAEGLISSTAGLLFKHSLFNGHPRFFGYITSSPSPIGMLGDFLATAVNANVGSWRLGPVATEIEAQTIRWIAELIGYPTTCGGLLVSGGNMANFVGLLAARAAAADWNLREGGMVDSSARRLRVYASQETHTWIQKATDLSGLGTDSIRWIPVDVEQRMDIVALRAAIAADRVAGDIPCLVAGTAGSVSTGAVDPLREIAEVCRDAGVWFHVDGAYGAFAACTPDAPADLGALALADSVALDPHKWLYAPLEAGAVLVRDPERLRSAFAYHPPYYHFGQEATNYVDFGPQNSRGFRALKVWLALQHVGRRGYAQMIGDDIRLSRRLFELVHAHPDLEPCTHSLSITTFRFVPRDLQSRIGTREVESYLRTLNEALLERIQHSGDLFVSHAFVGTRYMLRACIVNFNTSGADIDALPNLICTLGADVDAELRIAPLRPTLV